MTATTQPIVTTNKQETMNKQQHPGKHDDQHGNCKDKSRTHNSIEALSKSCLFDGSMQLEIAPLQQTVRVMVVNFRRRSRHSSRSSRSLLSIRTIGGSSSSSGTSSYDNNK